MLGQVVGKYRIVEAIAEGGMGMVYRAEHTVLGSPAAVKVLLPRFTVDPGVVERFFTEARATSAIRHVGIVEVFDFGMMPGNQAYIAMELLRGESLAEHLARRSRLAPALAVNIAIQMLGALDAAHVIGVVHRDLKPDNVFLLPDPGAPGGVRVKILDFGIAKLATDTLGERTKTRAGTILGTPAYMAPEQCRGGVEIDHRADLYAVGCLLFEMLTGRPVFVAEGGGEVMAKHIYEPAPRVRDLGPDVPAELDQLVAKFLTKAVAERPPSAAWALAALERVPLEPLPLEPDSGMFAAPSDHYAVTASGPGRAAPMTEREGSRAGEARAPSARGNPRGMTEREGSRAGEARAPSARANPRGTPVGTAPGGPPRAGSAPAHLVARGTPPPRIDDTLPRWLPIALVGVALVIAIIAVIAIGRSGGDLRSAPSDPPRPRPQVTPIEPAR